MHRTILRRGLASTHGGMRRMLKKQLSPVEFIKKSVQCGTYMPSHLTQGSLGKDNDDDDTTNTDDTFQCYPDEYQILSLNPPIPPPPRIPPRDRKKLYKKATSLPTDPLVKSYLKRYDARAELNLSKSSLPAAEEEARYASLFGLNTSQGAMGRKSTVLNHAYNFALRQFQVLHQEGDMTEEESIKVVEDLLAKENEEERRRSRERAENVVQWHNDAHAPLSSTEDEEKLEQESYHGADPDSEFTAASSQYATQAPAIDNTIPSILHSKPRAIQAMRIWGMRFQAVPYNQWTVGAATALDHWIAVDVLGMSEDTWNSLLDGDVLVEEYGSYKFSEKGTVNEEGTVGMDVQMGDLAQVRDIVTVRGALFPETLWYGGQWEDDEAYVGKEDGQLETTDNENKEETDATERSIDELLASLGGFYDDVAPEVESKYTATPETKDDTIARVVDELQEWRAKNLESPFENWNKDTKKKFNTWLANYVTSFANEGDGEVDLNATRDVLLSEPPLTREKSDSFWSNVRDEAQAEIFLQNLLACGLPDDSKSEEREDGELEEHERSRKAFRTFLTLPYKKQLRKLIDLGTLRPLFDEYTTESNREEFVRRYGEILLEGVEIEHLVPDPNGTVGGDNVNSLFGEEDGSHEGSKDTKLSPSVRKEDRFSIKMIKYGTGEYGTPRSERARLLYQAWNTHKAGRARYEELMFKKGKLGLKTSRKA